MKNIIKFIIFSFLIFFISSTTAYWGFEVKFISTSIIYSFFTWFVIHKNTKWKHKVFITISIVSTPFLIFFLPNYIFNFTHTSGSFLSSMAYILGIIIGVILNYSNRYIRIVMFFFMASVNIWIAVIGYSYYLNYINFQSFNGQINLESPSFEFITENGNKITNIDLKGKIVILDFWNTRCGVCFSEFPILEKKYQVYKKNPMILFFAVNVPFKDENINQSISKIRSKSYTFPILKAKNYNVANDFMINGFPTVIVINKENRIIYKGSIDDIDKVISMEINQ